MPVNVVFRTDPVAGTVVVDNENIKLYFNPDPQLQEVPNVENQPLEDAQRILSTAGFQIGQILNEESDTIARGSVIRTDPAAGSQVEQATTINLVVSSGPQQIAVPAGLVGQAEAEVRQLLESAPFNFRVAIIAEESDTVTAGLVIRTSPGLRRAGRHRERGPGDRLDGRAGHRGAERGRLVGELGPPAAGPVQRQRQLRRPPAGRCERRPRADPEHRRRCRWPRPARRSTWSSARPPIRRRRRRRRPRRRPHRRPPRQPRPRHDETGSRVGDNRSVA